MGHEVNHRNTALAGLLAGERTQEAKYQDGCCRGETADIQPKNVDLQLQARCATEAASLFKEWEEEQAKQQQQGAEYNDHYNKQLGHCFVMVRDSQIYADNGTITVSRNLYDAYERRLIGEYIWVNARHQKYWEVASNALPRSNTIR